MNITIAKQSDIRANMKKYFDLAYEGDTVIVPRKENHNIVILSEHEYKRMKKRSETPSTSPCLKKATGSCEKAMSS